MDHASRVSIKIRSCLAALAILALVAAPATASPDTVRGNIERAGKAVPGSYVVTLMPGSDPAAVANDLVRLHGGRLGHIYRHALEGFSIEIGLEGARALAGDPRVSLVEQDPVIEASATQTSPPWGLDRIDQRDRPLNASYNYNATGAGATVYVIDTGIRITHTDLGGRARHGFDFVDDDADASDCNGHGTHVAGTVGGNTYGVAKQASLVAVRVLDCAGSGAGSDIIAGIDWVTGQHDPGESDVANMSLGTVIGTSSTIDAAVRASIADGTTYSLAAGNGNLLGMAQSACNTSPARVAEGITVSATDNADRRASFANYGSCVDVFAPGVGIPSAWHTSDSATNTISGTSMAAPHVAGVAAQYLQLNPGAAPSVVAGAIGSNASAGKVTNPGSGSPNLLLYSAFI